MLNSYYLIQIEKNGVRCRFYSMCAERTAGSCQMVGESLTPAILNSASSLSPSPHQKGFFGATSRRGKLLEPDGLMAGPRMTHRKNWGREPSGLISGRKCGHPSTILTILLATA
jgi:hypothetical protein